MSIERKFDFITGIETSTKPTLTSPVSSDAGFITVDLSASSQTVIAGQSLTHPNLEIQGIHTYTINGGIWSSFLEVDGTLTVSTTGQGYIFGELFIDSGTVTVDGSGVLVVG